MPIDRRERMDSAPDAMLAMLEGWQAKLWSAMPAKVISFDPTEVTCSVQLAIQMQVRKPDGTTEWVDIKPLIHCPVVFQNGGGASMTFPIKPGNECLVVFASRCIDAWWQNGGHSNVQMELRMHDLSDGFVIVGPRSLANPLTAISTTDVQLRSDDGTAVISLNPTSHVINIQTPAAVTVTSTSAVSVTAPVINLGAVGQTLRAFVNDLFINFFNSHTHSSGGSGTPVTPMSSTQCSSTVKGG